MNKKIISAVLFLGLLLGSLLVGASSASATFGHDKCYDKVLVTAAYDETVVVTEAYTETVPGTPSQWWNFSPNKDQKKFQGPPSFPNDARGTWQGPHTNGGPSQDKTGTFQQGKGNASWFHREAGTSETYIEHDAVTEIVHHDAVYKDVEVPCVVIPEKPVKEDKVIYGDQIVDCEAGIVTVKVTTIKYTYTYDEETNAWVESSNSTDSTETHETSEVECPPVVVSPTEPPVVTPPTPVQPPVVDKPTPTATVVGQPAEPVSNESVPVLPNTGGTSKVILIGGIVLVLLGLYVVSKNARRRS